MNKTDVFANIWLKIEQKDNIPFSQLRLIIVINSAQATKWYTLGLWFCEAGKNWAANPIHLPTKIWGEEERDLKGNLGTYSSSDIRFNWKWNCLSRSHPSDVYPPIPSTRSFRVTIGAKQILSGKDTWAVDPIYHKQCDDKRALVNWIPT